MCGYFGSFKANEFIVPIALNWLSRGKHDKKIESKT